MLYFFGGINNFFIINLLCFHFFHLLLFASAIFPLLSYMEIKNLTSIKLDNCVLNLCVYVWFSLETLNRFCPRWAEECCTEHWTCTRVRMSRNSQTWLTYFFLSFLSKVSIASRRTNAIVKATIRRRMINDNFFYDKNSINAHYK